MTVPREIPAHNRVSRKAVLDELLAQHAELREMIERCEVLSEQVEIGQTDPGMLTREVARLRVAFDVHNQCEEQVLRPLLADSGAFAEVRVDHMVSDHVDEHRLMRTQLASNIHIELRATLARLRSHLESEERYFLSPQALRDDLIVVEGGD